MIGNQNEMSNLIVDKMIMKLLKFDKLEEVIEIFTYHQYLMYFPHYDITYSVLKKVLKEDKEGETIFNFMKILQKKHLIKLNHEIMTILDSINVKEKPFLIENINKYNSYKSSIKKRYQYLLDG